MAFTKLRRRVLEDPSGRVMVGFAPEGLVPGWYAQPPLSTKSGGFVLASLIAQKAAKDRPVFLVPMRTNYLEHMTQRKEFQIEVGAPVEVPRDRGSLRSWSAETREKFEAFANRFRARHLPEFSSDYPFAGLKLPRVDRPQPEVFFHEWMGTRHYQSCVDSLRHFALASIPKPKATQ